MDLQEITRSLDRFRRTRRAFAATILQRVLDYTRDTRTSISRIFARVDADGSGDLDIHEFQQALTSMKLDLTELEAEEVVAELDIDGSGTIAASEFLDKLKAFGRERGEDRRKCRVLFDEIDDDDSGFLDKDEVGKLAARMGEAPFLSIPFSACG